MKPIPHQKLDLKVCLFSDMLKKTCLPDSTLASTMDEVVCLVDEKENDVKSSLKRKLASPAQNAAKKAKQGDITNFFRKK